MKLATVRHAGRTTFGRIEGDALLDAGTDAVTLRSALADGSLGARVAAATTRIALADCTLLPPVLDPEKVLCVGVNYVSHRVETGRAEAAYPTIFTRFANTHVGSGSPLIVPHASSELDYEGELAVVIGRRGRHIPASEASGYVAGYSCYNDGSVRDWQRHSSQFTPGKNFVGTGGFGPWLVTADEIPDAGALTLLLRLNGVEMQRASTSDMIFSIADVIAYVSTFTELSPGDVIATGTPGGVGWKRTPPVFLKPGDLCEVEISGVGVLSNPVKLES